jgi:MFS transporter, DHA1 family, tetracycline resistance protein
MFRPCPPRPNATSTGIFIQGVFLKILNDAVGERWLVTLCFVLSAVHNVLYGLAKDKATIYVAVAVSSFGAMAFPTISAIKSNNVSSSEQGRIQGALYSLSALASASGPMVLRWVYQYTRDGAFAGPGSMFLVAAMLDAVAVLCAYALPVRGPHRECAVDVPFFLWNPYC